MKGLLYKDLIISRRFFIIAFAYCFMGAFLFAMIRLSMICGNLADNTESTASLERNMYLLRYTPCAVFLITFFTQNSCYEEVISGWRRFSLTTPLRCGIIVREKMLFRVLVLTAVYAVCILYVILLSVIGGEIVTPGIIGNVTSIYLAILALAFTELTLSFSLKNKQMVITILFGSFSVISTVLIFLLMMKLKSMNNDPSDIDIFDVIRGEVLKIRKYVLPVTAGAAALTAVLCNFLSVKALERR